MPDDFDKSNDAFGEIDFFMDTQGDEITGDEFNVQEDDSANDTFDPATMSGWTLAFIKDVKFDRTNVFGERSKNAGQPAPSIEVTWTCFNSKADGISINFDKYFAHPSTNYALNKMAKGLCLDYKEDPVRKNKKTGEPLRIYSFSEEKMKFRCALLYLEEQKNFSGEKTGYPQIKRKGGSPMIISLEEGLYDRDDWKQYIYDPEKMPLPYITTGSEDEIVASEKNQDDIGF